MRGRTRGRSWFFRALGLVLESTLTFFVCFVFFASSGVGLGELEVFNEEIQS